MPPPAAPPARKSGRKKGSSSYTRAETQRLLVCTRKVLPTGSDEWARVATMYNDAATRTAGIAERDSDGLKSKFRRLYNTQAKSGSTKMPEMVVEAKSIQELILGKMQAASFVENPSDEDHEESNDEDTAGRGDEAEDAEEAGDAEETEETERRVRSDGESEDDDEGVRRNQFRNMVLIPVDTSPSCPLESCASKDIAWSVPPPVRRKTAKTIGPPKDPDYHQPPITVDAESEAESEATMQSTASCTPNRTRAKAPDLQSPGSSKIPKASEDAFTISETAKRRKRSDVALSSIAESVARDATSAQEGNNDFIGRYMLMDLERRKEEQERRKEEQEFLREERRAEAARQERLFQERQEERARVDRLDREQARVFQQMMFAILLRQPSAAAPAASLELTAAIAMADAPAAPASSNPSE